MLLFAVLADVGTLSILLASVNRTASFSTYHVRLGATADGVW
jgi:hypothetical protein